MGQSAQTKARTLLANNHTNELREFYLLEKEIADKAEYTRASHRNAVARSRAITKLVSKHFMEYRVLYEWCLLKGFPPQHAKESSDS